jgi:CRISPR-associated protein Csm3
MTTNNVRLIGRVFVTGEIEAMTGLRIGDSQTTMTIGGVDLPVIRNRRTNEPYIPGSSLKGKMRSLSEKFTGAPQNFTVHYGGRDGRGKVRIHVAHDEQGKSGKPDYESPKYGWINKIFGITGDAGDWVSAPNRLLVRDVMLEPSSRDELNELKTDLPFTEVKWEAAIDRVTSAATPRQIERVPAGAVFGPMELVFSMYETDDHLLFGNLLTAMELLEDDYLGGHGSRGSGKIEFRALKVSVRKGDTYEEVIFNKDGQTLAELAGKKQELLDWVKKSIQPKEG